MHKLTTRQADLIKNIFLQLNLEGINQFLALMNELIATRQLKK